VGEEKLRFDGWVFDPESGDLERGGARIRLQEQSTLVLKELIAHAGSVVTREQLIALLWPKGIVDFDTGLNATIRKLRSALGDEAESPRYIETLPRRGYRFLGTPDAAPAPAPDPGSRAPPAQAEGDAARAPRSLRSWLAPVVAMAVIAGGALWLVEGTRPAWRNPLANARFTRLTDLPGRELAAVISRDGRTAAFVADRDGRTNAWLTQIGSGSFRNLTQGSEPELVNPEIRPLGFSADGSLVTIWTRHPGAAHDVNTLAAPVAGGPPALYLADTAEVAWSTDGTRLVYHTTAAGDPMFVKDLRREEVRRIYAAPAGVHCHFPLWSPDDDFIYFVRGIPHGAWDVWRIRPTGADPERLTFHNTTVTYPVLLERQTLLYLATDADGSGPWLYAMDLKERIPHRISSGLERYISLAASADGTRLLATVARTRTSLWSVSLTQDRPAPAAAVPLAPSSATELSPRFGPDYLLYVSPRSGRQGIWKLANGTQSELWSDSHASLVGAPAIAPDGRRIAFTAAADARTRLYVMESDGTRVRVVADSLPLQGNPAWDPDGRSIVSAVMGAAGLRLTRIFLDGSEPLTLVSEYSRDAVWSPDGRFLVYSGADVGTTFPLRAVDGDGRPYALSAPVLPRGARRVAFWRGSGGLVVLRGEMGHKNFWLIDLNTGVERQLTELPHEVVIGEFDVSPDGTRIVFDRTEEDSQIALIERAR
jgi:Tol biopolymer transport system component/DNA-binding winged helix-turn-helix (wHTH) protein